MKIEYESSQNNDSLQNPIFVFDGGCPFCRRFAELTELRSGIKGLVLIDGRDDVTYLQSLAREGFHLSNGAVLIVGDQIFHGAPAISWICSRITPSISLYKLLSSLMASNKRSELIYPILLTFRRIILWFKHLPIDPLLASSN